MSRHGFASIGCTGLVTHCVTNLKRIRINTQRVLICQKLRVTSADFRDSVSEFDDVGFALAHGVIFCCGDTRTT